MQGRQRELEPNPQVLQGRVDGILEQFVDDLLMDIRLSGDAQKEELLRQRQVSTHLRHKLSETNERRRKTDIQMDLMQGQLLRRSTVMDDMRSSYYKELSVLREQIFQKGRLGSAFEADQWGQLYDPSSFVVQDAPTGGGDSAGLVEQLKQQMEKMKKAFESERKKMEMGFEKDLNAVQDALEKKENEVADMEKAHKRKLLDLEKEKKKALEDQAANFNAEMEQMRSDFADEKAQMKEDFEDAMERLRVENEEALDKLRDELEKISDRLNAEIDRLKEVIEGKDEEIEKLEQRMASAAEEIAQAKKEMERFLAEKEQLEKQLQNVGKEMESLKAQKEQAERECEKREMEKEELRAQYAKLQEDSKNALTDVVRLREELLASQSELEAVQADLSSVMGKNAELEEKLRNGGGGVKDRATKELEQAIQDTQRASEEKQAATWDLLNAGMKVDSERDARAQGLKVSADLDENEKQRVMISKLRVFERLEVRSQLLLEKMRTRRDLLEKERQRNLERVLMAACLLVKPSSLRESLQLSRVTIGAPGPTTTPRLGRGGKSATPRSSTPADAERYRSLHMSDASAKYMTTPASVNAGAGASAPQSGRSSTQLTYAYAPGRATPGTSPPPHIYDESRQYLSGLEPPVYEQFPSHTRNCSHALLAHQMGARPTSAGPRVERPYIPKLRVHQQGADGTQSARPQTAKSARSAMGPLSSRSRPTSGRAKDGGSKSLMRSQTGSADRREALMNVVYTDQMNSGSRSARKG